MVIDVNSHVLLKGKGEHQVRKYTRKIGDNYKTYYDADLYQVEREFDLVIDGLTIESNSDRLVDSDEKTNNIINSIMPFDIENCVKYDANYIKGYNSERRNTNVEQLHNIVSVQASDIARYKANDTITQYDRGVNWSTQDYNIKGEQWKAAYLPVWLYSYQEINGNKKLLHYVAVNARTKETMGSVPIHMPKLVLVSFIVEILGFIAMLSIDFDYNWIFLLSGFIYFLIIYSRYRNSNARHNYESTTKTTMTNLVEKDTLITRKTGLTNSMLEGANNKAVKGIRNKF